MPIHQTDSSIAVLSSHKTLTPVAAAYAQQLNLPVTEADDDTYDYLLKLTEWPTPPGYRCELHKTASGSPGPIFVEFTTGKAAHRRVMGGGRKQTLARAVGLKAKFNPAILDATGGLGRDAFVLASLGCQVTLLERQPLLYILLENGIERARHDESTADIANRMQCIHADANDHLSAIDFANEIDVIYLDPMYPKRGNSAKVKKEMQYLQDLVGDDLDAGVVLEKARHSQVRRVVVKRPAGASALNDLKPQAIVSSKNTRYDIYFPSTTDQ
jgi:16S rRNA (guanine1516-N2)-methyltransferase